MKIEIRERLRPFSHLPGASCVIPGSHSIVTAFPTLLHIDSHVIPLKVTGPVRGFTLSQDLEKNCVWVFGQAPEGRFKIRIEAKIGGILVDLGREKKLLPLSNTYQVRASFERLSMGSHKAQDWDLVLRRFDLEEILPILFALGQKTPAALPRPSSGTARLLNFSDLPGLESFCRAAFRSLLVPRLVDDQHQGFCQNEEADGNPFFLLEEASRRIRSLFIVQEDKALSLLPVCLFPAGRMSDVELPGIGRLYFEWLKGRLSRFILRASHTTDIQLRLHPSIQTFRLKTKENAKPVKHMISDPILIKTGQIYFCDRFYV